MEEREGRRVGEREEGMKGKTGKEGDRVKKGVKFKDRDREEGR